MILHDFLQKKRESQNLGTTPRPGLRPEEGALQLETRNWKFKRETLMPVPGTT